MAAQPDTAEHVDLEKPQPVCIFDCFERLRLKDPNIVHEDIHIRKLADGFTYAVSRTQVGSKTRCGLVRSQFCERCVNTLLRPAIDDQVRAFVDKRLCDGKSDTCGGAAYQSD